MNIYDLINNALDARWTAQYGAAAQAEGWCLSVSYGSADGPLQLQMIEEPAEGMPGLDNDEEAWRIVANGAGEHHRVALELLAQFNPDELLRVRSRKA